MIINLHDWTVVLFVFNVLFINVLSLLDACLLFSDPIQKKTNKKQNKTKQNKTKNTQNIRCKCISCCNLVDLLYVVKADVFRLVVFSVSKIIFKLK